MSRKKQARSKIYTFALYGVILIVIFEVLNLFYRPLSRFFLKEKVASPPPQESVENKP